jgi:hypothetical protein
VSKEFNRVLVDDDFTKLAGTWNQLSNAENLFIGTEKGYQAWRKNSKSGFFILPEKGEQYSVFEVSLQFVFEPGSKSQSAGMVLQAQADGNGALVIEVNGKKQYRIKRAVNNRMVPITGEGEGWVKSKKAISSGLNTIMVRTYDKIYDLYINDVFIRSFTEIEYSEGKIGILIGPNSKATFQHLTIRTDDDHASQKGNNSGPLDEEKTLSQIIVKLKETINKKDKRIGELEAELRNSNSRGTQDTFLIKQKAELESKWLQCTRELATIKSQTESLQNKVESLEEFKRVVKESENGDVIINLTKLNATQKEQIAVLQSEVRIQKQALEQLKGDKQELDKQLKASASNIDQLQNERIELMQRIIEKDSLVAGLEEKLKLMDDALTACSQGVRKSEPKEKKKSKKKKREEPILFDE